MLPLQQLKKTCGTTGSTKQLERRKRPLGEECNDNGEHACAINWIDGCSRLERKAATMKKSACDNCARLSRLRNESHRTSSSLQNLQHSERAREGDYQQPTFRSQSTRSPAVEEDDHNRKCTVRQLRRRGQIHDRQRATMMKTPRADLGTAGFLRGGCDAC